MKQATVPILLLSTFLVAAWAATPLARESSGRARPAAHAEASFTHGVASGDVRMNSAVLWTRLDREARLVAEVSSDPEFRGRVLRRGAYAAAERDYVAKRLVRPLRPDTRYFYRFLAGDAVSEVGTFRTAPLPSRRTDLRFVYSGDSDGFSPGGVPFFNNFETLDAARNEDPLFFLYLGDTIYGDSSIRQALTGEGPAETTEQYHALYRENRGFPALRNLLAATSVYAIWDDHEVVNDFDGETVDPQRYANGRQAFVDYMPIEERHVAQDPGCAGSPLFRIFRWGKTAELIIPDQRSCRSADLEEFCQGDLAPTMPAPLRQQFGLPPSPPEGCLEALFDPSRTMLGPTQKERLKSALASSRSKFKFVASELAMQQFYVLPYDRWEGYAAERNEILEFIRSEGIDNVVFLTTDNHANLVNEVFIDGFLDPEPLAVELVTGPIATFTLKEEIELLFGPQGVEALQIILDLVGMNCRNLDRYAYGLVELDSRTETATITLKDEVGAPVRDQRNPDVICQATIGP